MFTSWWWSRDWQWLACESPEVSSRGVGQWWPTAGLGAPSVTLHAWNLLKQVAIIFITSTRAWFRSNNREETQPHPWETENCIKDLLSMAPPIRTRLFPQGNDSQMIPRTCSRRITWKLLGMQIPRTSLTLLNQKLWSGDKQAPQEMLVKSSSFRATALLVCCLSKTLLGTCY